MRKLTLSSVQSWLSDEKTYWRRLWTGGLGSNTTPSSPPTVQIALTPTTLSLSVGAPTATVTGIAKDQNAVVTGQAVFYYSSNPAAATCNRTTGLVTRVAAGSATIYALLT